MTLGPEHARSLWAATAIPAPPTTALSGDVSADVAVVGAGFTGLVAALHVAEAGLRVAVVDAEDIGWGASGRNNGQVIPGLKLDPNEVVRKLGQERGEALVRWSGSAPDLVFDLIARLGLDCAPLRNGWIQPAYTYGALETIESRNEQWARRGAVTRILCKSELDSLLGTPAFVGGWLDERGGSIQPLSYARGLAAAAQARGATLYSRTRARRLEREGSAWTLRSDGGSVRAEHVIIATAAYSDSLVPGLKRSVIPVRTAQVATRPLSEGQLSCILPQRHVASDTRRLLTSMRISPDGRLVMGGAGATGGPHKERLERHLHDAAAELWAHLPLMRWEFGWSGYLALTPDHLPHIHEPARNILVALGCNGRGIAVSTGMGILLSERARGTAVGDLPIPIRTVRGIPFYELRNIGIVAATMFNRVQDRIERIATCRRMRAS